MTLTAKSYCPNCRQPLSETGRCWNPTCRLAGIQIAPLRETKDGRTSIPSQASYPSQTSSQPSESEQVSSVRKPDIVVPIRREGRKLKLGTESRTISMHSGKTLQVKNVRPHVVPNNLVLVLNREPTEREIELIYSLTNLLLTAYDLAKDEPSDEESN